MRAYMKSEMPYHGVTAPLCRQVFRKCFADLQFTSPSAWKNAVLHIWRNARFREERYAAIFLCEARCSREFQTPAALEVYEELIVTGAWWDYVDSLASHSVGDLLRKYPREIRPVMKAWSRCPDMWKRRTAILSQLKFRKETDLALLYAWIEPSLDSKEFFIRKAIGWALRQYAWSDPAELRRYVLANETRLSPLSKREALKNL